MPSENVVTSPDRRTRKREARRDHLLGLAADIVERDGLDGLTMAALAEAADYATASLYTYFPSRSALVAALQRDALAALARVAEEHLARWDEQLSTTSTSRREVALSRLWAFSDLFLSAPQRHAREFRLQQQLLVSPGAEDTADAAAVVPSAMLVLEVPRRLLSDAVGQDALDEPAEQLDPVGEPVDGSLMRTLTWIVALNGALMVDGLSTGLPSTGVQLGHDLTRTLLVGWGAPGALVDRARTLADGLDQLEPSDRTGTTNQPGPTARSNAQEARP